MNPNRSAHLTPAQLDRLLATATPTAGQQQHLEACAACRQQLESLHAGFGDLRSALTAYSSATWNPAPFALRRAVAAARPQPRPVWRSRLAFAGSFAVLALGVGVTTLLPHHPAGERPTPVPTVSSQARANELPAESDEALLDGIDQDLTDSVPPSLKPLAIASAQPSTSTQSAHH